MKKIIVFLGILLFVSGCGKYSDKNIVKEINKKINSSKAYQLNANLEIYRNEQKYEYTIESSYKEGDLFKVDLINKNNNHEQIILKNSDGVYVLTPSLNKSFKFQSDWPYNNSQIYLLQPILSDITADKNKTFKEIKDGYLITSKVDYSTEKEFKKQKVYFDKSKNITKVEIVDDNDNIKMKLDIIDINYKPKFDSDYFSIEKYQMTQEKEENKEEETSKIDDIVFPMYVPTDTYLTGQDVVKTDDGERVILTFAGESTFTVVQENVKETSSTDFVYGDPYLILDTVGLITDYSVSWISDGIEYSVMSDSLNTNELLTVAQSINVKAVGK